MKNLSNLQTEIINNEDPVIFVEAAAASGKTAIIVEKIKKELSANKGSVVAFTFTNAAAEEMYERVGQVDNANLFIGTIHSYCVRLLLSHGIDKALKYCEDQRFDELFQLVKKNIDCIKPVYCLICDEMQDCNHDQFEFIFEMGRYAEVIFGGRCQRVKAFRDIVPAIVEQRYSIESLFE